MGGVDLVIITAGIGHENPDLAWRPEAETIAVNVTGFAAMAGVAMRHFIARVAATSSKSHPSPASRPMEVLRPMGSSGLLQSMSRASRSSKRSAAGKNTPT